MIETYCTGRSYVALTQCKNRPFITNINVKKTVSLKHSVRAISS